MDKCAKLRFRSRIRNETVPNITDLRNEVSQDAGPGVERTRRQTRGALWALCHLGDAAVPNPGEVFNCSEARDGSVWSFHSPNSFSFRCGEVIFQVLLPSDYLQVGGFVVGLFQVSGRCMSMLNTKLAL